MSWGRAGTRTKAEGGFYGVMVATFPHSWKFRLKTTLCLFHWSVNSWASPGPLGSPPTMEVRKAVVSGEPFACVDIWGTMQTVLLKVEANMLLFCSSSCFLLVIWCLLPADCVYVVEVFSRCWAGGCDGDLWTETNWTWWRISECWHHQPSWQLITCWFTHEYLPHIYVVLLTLCNFPQTICTEYIINRHALL